MSTDVTKIDKVELEEIKEEEKVEDDNIDDAIEVGTKSIEVQDKAKKVDEEEIVFTPEDETSSNTEPKKKRIKTVPTDAPWKDRMWEIAVSTWPLGFIAFGGPSANTALLRDCFVVQRQMVDEDQFQELFAIGQGLPGPSSTQLLIAVALVRAGPLGGLLAFTLWSLPGLIALTVFGLLISAFVDPKNPPWYLIGLPPAAISLVFVALHAFVLKLDKLGYALALMSSSITILISNDGNIKSTSSQWVFPLMLAFGGFVTFLDARRSKPYSTYDSPSKGWDKEDDATLKRIGIPLWVGAALFVLWLIMLVASVTLAAVTKIDNPYFNIFQIMYRIGSIIYGGGQVVLPMLKDEVVPNWMTQDQFLQGLGIATSLPGPLFNFSAYLGAVYQGLPGALFSFLGLMTPGNLLIYAAIPFWARIRHNRTFRSVLSGVNAAAVGLVGAACVILWESAVSTSSDAIIFTIALTLHVGFGFPAPVVVLIGGIIGAIMHPDVSDLGQVPYCIDEGYVEPSDNN